MKREQVSKIILEECGFLVAEVLQEHANRNGGKVDPAFVSKLQEKFDWGKFAKKMGQKAIDQFKFGGDARRGADELARRGILGMGDIKSGMQGKGDAEGEGEEGAGDADVGGREEAGAEDGKKKLEQLSPLFVRNVFKKINIGGMVDQGFENYMKQLPRDDRMAQQDDLSVLKKAIESHMKGFGRSLKLNESKIKQRDPAYLIALGVLLEINKRKVL